MTVDHAREWIVRASLLITGATFLFFLAAPALRYPLLWDQSFKIFQIVLPVFLGYLGSAAHFVFKPENEKPSEGNTAERDATIAKKNIFALLIKGPIYLFAIIAAAAIAAFGYSNSRWAAEGSGISPDTLATVFSLALGLLAVTTNVGVSYLFATEKKGEKQ
jgi:hypothetical protein